MRYFALVCDYDSTLADQGIVKESTITALRRLAESGRKRILVTGRELDDLLQVFPAHEVFDRIVAENGALLYNPSTRKSKPLAEPPTSDFVRALREAGVEPLSVGKAILSTVKPHDSTVLTVIRELGLEMQVIYNRDSVMVLPSGVNKTTGLRAALSELGLSSHNAVAVGDAENDHALLNTCECRVAVANAIPTLKERADFVTTEPDGKGVEQLIDKLLLDDLAGINPRAPRYPIVLGHTNGGTEVTIPSYGAKFLIAGPSASGKSTVVTGILEQLIENGYQVCLVDPEGDHDSLEKVLVLGSSSKTPDISEISAALQKPTASVSVNLVGVKVGERPEFFSALLRKLQEFHARTGRPHWIIIDEAHHVLPATLEPGVNPIPQPMTNVLMITVQSSAVLASALHTMDGVIAVGRSPQQTIEEFSNVIGRALPVDAPLQSQPGEAFVWFVADSRGPVSVRVRPSTIETRRHKRKYAEGRLEPENNFVFKGPQGKLNLRVPNLMMFNHIADGVDDETWLFHLRRNHYSQWMREAIKDESLASEVAQVENDPKMTAQESRKKVIDAVNRRYTSPETAAHA
jgi:HAD superfamily hydrolase (TIGR01484 family)